jgi:tetratricopeptide (TPR) repeat protein
VTVRLVSAKPPRVRALAAQVTGDDVERVLRQAAEIGLVSPLDRGFFLVHPALPWYFQRLFAETFGPPDGPEGEAAVRAYVETMNYLANKYHQVHITVPARILPVVILQEANFLNARHLAIRHQWRDLVMLPTRGLEIFYEFTGRDLELARLTQELVPLLTDPSTGLPPPGLEQDFLALTEMRSRLARRARNWELAERLLRTSLQVSERRAEAARSAAEPDRVAIRSLGIDYQHLALLLIEQGRPESIGYLEKALAIFEEVEAWTEAARAAANIANVYLTRREASDLNLAEKWLMTAIERFGADRLGRGKCLAQLAQVKYGQLEHSLAAGADQEAAREIWTAAVQLVNEAFQQLPEEAIRDLASVHDVAGDLCRSARDVDQALSHYRQRIRISEELGQRYDAGVGRWKAASTLALARRFDDAALFAERAIQDFSQSGSQAMTAQAKELLDRIRAEQMRT